MVGGGKSTVYSSPKHASICFLTGQLLYVFHNYFRKGSVGNHRYGSSGLWIVCFLSEMVPGLQMLCPRLEPCALGSTQFWTLIRTVNFKNIKWASELISARFIHLTNRYSMGQQFRILVATESLSSNPLHFSVSLGTQVREHIWLRPLQEPELPPCFQKKTVSEGKTSRTLCQQNSFNRFQWSIFLEM